MNKMFSFDCTFYLQISEKISVRQQKKLKEPLNTIFFIEANKEKIKDCKESRYSYSKWTFVMDN